jgi:hypothetical protein
MSTEVHSEIELYRLESRPASKLIWIETIDRLATRLPATPKPREGGWRVLAAHRRAASPKE